MKNQKEFSTRAWIVFGLFAALGISIFGRILWIQSAEHEQWKEVGERFESSVRDINPSRGQIYAINGNVLATSVPIFEVRWDSKSEAINWNTFDAELDSLCLGLSQVLSDRSPREYRELLRNGKPRTSKHPNRKTRLVYPTEGTRSTPLHSPWSIQIRIHFYTHRTTTKAVWRASFPNHWNRP
jgi:cell division protein FtsI (penicillin-binding protein 3)